MSDLILFWHRRDLRIADNIGLDKACEQSQRVVGVFCLDLNILSRDDIAPARVTYMIGCLQELQQSYTQMGSQLLIIKGEPIKAIANLASSLKVKEVFWNWDVEPYSKERDLAVINALQEKGIGVKNFWDQLLHSPEELRTGTNQAYTVYTPFWKNWIKQSKAQPVAGLKNVQGLNETEREAAIQAGAIALPTAKDLGFNWDNQLVIAPGEKAALDKLQEFADSAIYDYQQQRDFPANDGTSHLSAALKFGAIGIRTVWNTTINVMGQSPNDKTTASITTWQHELAWREFYQHAMYNFPELATGAYRQVFKDFPWNNNEEHFQAWCEGKTGYPIVDAAMRQMNQIGWMHNRCRMIVANFLTKDLLINSQRGEKYFFQHLIDGDLSANNGGWQWSASSGMDPKPMRIFNPFTQAQKYDPEAKYIRQWVPELRSFSTSAILTGQISIEQRQSVGYPAPIVDHNQQQRLFKERYKEQKDNLI